jgi:hypothetical protein
MNFSLTPEQKEKVNNWLKEQYVLAIEKQRQEITKSDSNYSFYEMCWDMGQPYTGAIGGGETYEFTPTSLGPIVKVRYSLTDNTIDVTDYDMW